MSDKKDSRVSATISAKRGNWKKTKYRSNIVFHNTIFISCEFCLVVLVGRLSKRTNYSIEWIELGSVPVKHGTAKHKIPNRWDGNNLRTTTEPSMITFSRKHFTQLDLNLTTLHRTRVFVRGIPPRWTKSDESLSRSTLPVLRLLLLVTFLKWYQFYVLYVPFYWSIILSLGPVNTIPRLQS